MKRAETRSRQRPHRGRARRDRLPVTLVLVVVLVALSVVAAGCAGVKSSDGGSSMSAGGPGTPGSPGAGEVRLVVSHDFGATVSHDVRVPFEEGATALQLLAEQADVETGYGGGFVTAVDGQKSASGSGDEAADWFYWVDGRMGRTGAGSVKLRAGQTVWWDYHRWQGAMFIPAVLQAFPRPWSRTAVPLIGDVAGQTVAAWAERSGIAVAGEAPLSEPPAGDAIVTATTAQVAATPWLRDLLAQKNDIGVFVQVTDGHLWALDHGGTRTRQVPAAVIAAPNPAAELKTLLIILGENEDAVARVVEQPDLAGRLRIGVGLLDDGLLPLPADR
jgi:hypothetical protein